MRQQTQSVSLCRIPPAALSFALTATIDAFISRPPLVLQRLSPRTQLSHQPSKSSSATTTATSCPSSSFLMPHLHQMRCVHCRSVAAVLPLYGCRFVFDRRSLEVLCIQSRDSDPIQRVGCSSWDQDEPHDINP